MSRFNGPLLVSIGISVGVYRYIDTSIRSLLWIGR